jgi:hypothetical protein
VDVVPEDPRTAGPRWRSDLPVAVGVVIGCVLLGAPAGLLWSALAPRLTVTLTAQGPSAPDLQSTKAFIGADGTFLVIALLAGLLCGGLAWWFARRGGPWTVGALVLGGLLAAAVASHVGLMPGSDAAIAALSDPAHHSSGSFELFLGRRESDGLHMRAPWAAVGWPVGALLAFLTGAFREPDELD